MSELAKRLKARAWEMAVDAQFNGVSGNRLAENFLSFAAEVPRKATNEFEWGSRRRGVTVSSQNLEKLADELEGKGDE